MSDPRGELRTGQEPLASTVWDEWETFRGIGCFVDHWSRPGWTERTETFHWFLTFETADDLHRLAEQCQADLDGIDSLDRVPAALLHLTIERLALADAITPDQVAAVVEQARHRCSKLAPFPVRIGPLAGSTGAVRFSVSPHEPIAHLRRLLIDTADEVLGREDPTPGEPSPFVPHVSIAYSNADVPAGPIIDRVEQLRRLGSVIVPIQQVELVRLRRDHHVYVWTPVATLNLGG